MANRIKGITVEIGGDTTKLSKALEGVNKNIKNTQTQLKDVEKLLKLDPTNTELLSQKQLLLLFLIISTVHVSSLTTVLFRKSPFRYPISFFLSLVYDLSSAQRTYSIDFLYCSVGVSVDYLLFRHRFTSFIFLAENALSE